MQGLSEVPVVTHRWAKVGEVLDFGDMIYVHPLDFIALHEPDPLRRLEAAMKYILDDINYRFDKAIWHRTRPITRSVVHTQMKMASNGLAACGEYNSYDLLNMSANPENVTCWRCYRILKGES